MTERRANKPNIDLFMDLMRQAEDDPSIADLLQNSTVVFLPDDNPDLSLENYEHAKLLALKPTVFIKASKSEGSDHYDIFKIQEIPIEL